MGKQGCSVSKNVECEDDHPLAGSAYSRVLTRVYHIWMKDYVYLCRRLCTMMNAPDEQWFMCASWA